MRVVKYTTLLSNGLPCLVKEKGVNYDGSHEHLDNPSSVQQMMKEVFKLDMQTEEYLYMVCLSAKGHCLGVFEVSHGTVNSSLVTPREVFLKALLCGAVHIVLCHNHPSGDVWPSGEDTKITKRIYECGKMMNIELSDHIIVGENNYYSFRENGVVITEYLHEHYPSPEKDPDYGNCTTCKHYSKCNICSDCHEGSMYDYYK